MGPDHTLVFMEDPDFGPLMEILKEWIEYKEEQEIQEFEENFEEEKENKTPSMWDGLFE